jgi:protein TonB
MAAMVAGVCRAEPAPDAANRGSVAPQRSYATCPAVQFSNCHYVTRPSGADFAGAYPEAASERTISGFGIIRCAVAADGWFRDCTVLNEAPMGKGFGAAALQISRHFRIKMDDGSPVPPGATTTSIPIRFNMR